MKKYCLAIALVLLLALVGCAEHEHSWKEEVVKEATCGASGLKVYTCEVCEATREEEIPATGEHTWNSGVVSTEPKCTEEGVKTFTCTVCKETKAEKIPATGHSYVWTVVKDPDCVNDGSEEEVCSKCDAKGNTREVKALGHNFEGDICTGCKNSKTVIENAEARIGTKYFAEFEDAVHEAVNSTDESKKTVDVLKDRIGLADAHCPEVNGSVTINAHGADFGNGDISVYHYNRSGYELKSGKISIVINDARNLHVWGDPDLLRPDDTEINIEMNRCVNVGDSKTGNKGLLIYLTGKKGVTNVILSECSVTKASSPVYTNASGTIEIVNCKFVECAVPINMNYKATDGTRRITIDGCEFSKCGCTVEEDSTLSNYAAPIRVVHSVAGSDDCVTIKNTSITGTVGSNGDVLLLVKHETDSKIQEEAAVLENNKTDLKVVYGKGADDFKIVKAGTSATLKVEVPTT